jgi:SAM-dependent methyltransferase
MRENHLVKDQYTRWPYPEPVDDLNVFFKEQKQLGCPSTDRGFYGAFPRRERFSPRILIAGCGAYQAAAIAFKNPESDVVGVDISTTSLELTNKLKRKHKLSNLTLREMSVLDIANLRQTFDLIISTGVIHHLPNPSLALEAFKSALSVDGAIHLMVYGSTLRVGVYWVQDAFKRLGIIPTTAREVWDALGFIRKLPKHHPVHAYIAAAKSDISFEGGVIDTFFHSQDTSYTLEEVFNLVAQAGFVFNGFQNNADYFHEVVLGNSIKTHYAEEFSQMTFFEQAQCVDLLGGHRGTHRIFISQHDTFSLNTRNPPEQFDHTVPAQVGLQSYDTSKGIGTAYRLEPYPEFYPGKPMLAVTKLINAKRTFGEITQELVRNSKGLGREQIRELVFKVSRVLWMRGALIFIK